jgi:hypothetical protein
MHTPRDLLHLQYTMYSLHGHIALRLSLSKDVYRRPLAHQRGCWTK